MSYAALQTLWPTLSTSLTTDQKLAAVNAMTAPGPLVDVTATSVNAYLLTNFKLAALCSYADAPPAGAVAEAVVAAKNLTLDLRLPQPPNFGMSNPATYASMQAMLNILASDPLTEITAADVAAILALAATTVSWSQANGLETPLTATDAANAGLS